VCLGSERRPLTLSQIRLPSSALVILDEASASLDHDTDHIIQKTIRKEITGSLLCIAHRLNTVADFDRILCLDRGSVVAFDTPYNVRLRETSCCQTDGPAAATQRLRLSIPLSRPRIGRIRQTLCDCSRRPCFPLDYGRPSRSSPL
jgi:ABC-type multidrug transport system ATPase subunit